MAKLRGREDYARIHGRLSMDDLTLNISFSNSAWKMPCLVFNAQSSIVHDFPWLGRFLSPDPFVQSPGYSQSYNRYSYCFNNPLKYSDPSGYNPWKLEVNPMHFGGDSPNYYANYYLGYMGPGSGNHWSDGMNSYRDWKLMSSATFNNFYGQGAYDQACNFDSNPATQNAWRSGQIDMSQVMTDHRYWNPIAGEEVYREFEYKNGKHYVNIYYDGAWVSLFYNLVSGDGVYDVSQAGLNFIAGYEGYSATTYQDVAGLPTIGYGHLIKSGESFGTLSKDAALQLLKKDASFAVNAVNKYVKVTLSQNQFDALTSLAFNIGADAFANSTVLRNVNSANTLSIDKSFMMWNKARIDGVLTPIQGLTNRRKAEANLFLNGNY